MLYCVKIQDERNWKMMNRTEDNLLNKLLKKLTSTANDLRTDVSFRQEMQKGLQDYGYHRSSDITESDSDYEEKLEEQVMKALATAVHDVIKGKLTINNAETCKESESFSGKPENDDSHSATLDENIPAKSYAELQHDKYPLKASKIAEVSKGNARKRHITRSKAKPSKRRKSQRCMVA